ncbi:MAG: hypothetical protein AAF547_01870 [Actinomycetota bacterium]
MIKAEGVPIAMTVFAILMGLGGTVIGILALADPTSAASFVDGADDLATSWAGRNLGLGVAMLVAVAMRQAGAYAAAFAGGVCRELSDVIVEFNVAFFVIMLVEIFCLAWCARAVFSTGSASAATS